MKAYRTVAALSLAVLAVLASAGRGEDNKWGTIKGKVVFNGAAPERAKVAVDTDKAFCEKAGPVLSDELVVDAKTKGVKWVLVWLVDVNGGNKIPINPALPPMAKTVVIDQPCCSFEPHVLGLRTGQTLVAKNSATVVHNVNIIGGDDNPNKNIAIPPGKMLEVDGWKSTSPTRDVPIQCTIHKWMNAHVRVFDHPYFAVTNDKGEFEIKDAPAGKFRLVIWQESVGWVAKEGKDSGKKGITIEIKPGAVTDLGAIKLTPEK